MSDLSARCFIKRGTSLWAADMHADDFLRGIKDGSEVLVTIRRPRSVQHHRKLFALFAVVLEQTDRWADSTMLLEDLKLATGLFETRVSALTGMPYPVPASISFAAMSQDRFAAWYEKAIRVLSEHLGTDVETLSREVSAADAASTRRAA
ncbi:hypothetical protein [Methylobacterium sp. P1-11]|uniref:hypothetical protein n=1 Tax=Methylobacterium sp. P1-11 TaxID=2024616 RepID=UPI0011F08B75|nr:hypothetical protein [Methylobacterium sp. P1-11]